MFEEESKHSLHAHALILRLFMADIYAAALTHRDANAPCSNFLNHSQIALTLTTLQIAMLYFLLCNYNSHYT